ncbi:N-acetylglucosamine-6-phosphate deacetylase [Flagellimonas olearia]|uniref:N-acetylglucosamine-6-phosphate deacetylase n=1 Tax=Flagellimonas olearia TaxID=552546 RepID=A0A6I1E386_9FLAO|nr:N-acetylglucosamine-6-phosphate deacetylase [Allomuricauda olearia]KAB7530390.1 N-acetylglucosamine-6-phosphate deacetylase [Allomuricauda olearia]
MDTKYFDIQVNGYGGVDYNQNDLTLEDLKLSCSKLMNDHVEGILATIITANFDAMVLRIKNLVNYRKQDSLIGKMIKGIHLEGPFINREEGYRGAHPKNHILSPNRGKLEELLDAAEGLCRVVTLAPEMDSHNVLTKFLYSKDVIVSAGHCNPSLKVLRSAIDAGLSMFTHLGNGCPQVLPRHDNIIQKVLSLSGAIKICFIADGVHVPFYALKNYISMAGVENCMITTDAMAASGAGPGRYRFNDIELEVGEDRVVREPGKLNFSGSALDMKSSALNLKKELGFSEEEIHKLTYANPLQLLKF